LPGENLSHRPAEAQAKFRGDGIGPYATTNAIGTKILLPHLLFPFKPYDKNVAAKYQFPSPKALGVIIIQQSFDPPIG
jgi:hypothetical protein